MTYLWGQLWNALLIYIFCFYMLSVRYAQEYNVNNFETRFQGIKLGDETGTVWQPRFYLLLRISLTRWGIGHVPNNITNASRVCNATSDQNTTKNNQGNHDYLHVRNHTNSKQCKRDGTGKLSQTTGVYGDTSMKLHVISYYK